MKELVFLQLTSLALCTNTQFATAGDWFNSDSTLCRWNLRNLVSFLYFSYWAAHAPFACQCWDLPHGHSRQHFRCFLLDEMVKKSWLLATFFEGVCVPLRLTVAQSFVFHTPSQRMATELFSRRCMQCTDLEVGTVFRSISRLLHQPTRHFPSSRCPCNVFDVIVSP